jgi:GT2 family glycosyltransferase
MNVPFLSGCFMFFRTSALKQVGLFDERFFLYAEDTDLSRRMHQQFKTLFYPKAEIFHVHARGSYKNFVLTLHNLKSAAQYFNKWGWFYDPIRKEINRNTLLKLNQ